MSFSIPPPCRDIPTLLDSLEANPAGAALSFYRGRNLVGELSRAELVATIRRVANHLSLRFGLRRGDRIALLTGNCIEVPVLVLAAMRLGAVVVPLNPTAPPDDWAFILRHSGAKGLCATRELLEQARAEVEFTLPLEELLAAPAGAEAPPAEDLSDAMAVVLYTSGTTGQPKGVALSHRNIVSNAWSMARNFGLSSTTGGATQLAVLPLHHAHAFGFGLMSSLLARGHLVCAEKLDPFSWAEVIRTRSVTWTSVVPSLLPLLLGARAQASKIPTLRGLLVSSAPMSTELARDFEEKTEIPLIQGWGLSEYTNFACCLSPGGEPDDHRALFYGREIPSVGPALEGTEVSVLNGGGVPANEGERGELVVRGHSRMIGYFHDDEATARTIDAGGWLHTGDEGYFTLHNGRPNYFIAGRIKEIIIRGGEKYSPLALERRLFEGVPELAGKAVVLGFPHHAQGEEIGAYVEIDLLSEELRTRLAAAIAAMPVELRPKVVLHGPAPIPRTHTGKIQRRKLVPLFASHVQWRGALRIDPAG